MVTIVVLVTSIGCHRPAIAVTRLDSVCELKSVCELHLALELHSTVTHVQRSTAGLRWLLDKGRYRFSEWFGWTKR